MGLQLRIGRQQARQRNAVADRLARLGHHAGHHAGLRRADLDALARAVLGLLLGDLGEVSFELALHHLRLQRQFAAARPELLDVALLGGTLALQRLRLRAQAEQFPRAWSALRRRDEVVGAKRLQPRQRLLGQREALLVQARLGVDLRQFVGRSVDLPIDRRGTLALEIGLLCAAPRRLRSRALSVSRMLPDTSAASSVNT